MDTLEKVCSIIEEHTGMTFKWEKKAYKAIEAAMMNEYLMTFFVGMLVGAIITTILIEMKQEQAEQQKEL